MNDLILDSTTREDALSQLWVLRGKFEQEDKLEEFEKLEKEIKSVPVLNLTVAVDFSKEEISEIVERIRKMFKKNVFLELRVDTSLIGGCVFVWDGQVHDFSLKKTISDKRLEFKKLLWK